MHSFPVPSHHVRCSSYPLPILALLATDPFRSKSFMGTDVMREQPQQQLCMHAYASNFTYNVSTYSFPPRAFLHTLSFAG